MDVKLWLKVKRTLQTRIPALNYSVPRSIVSQYHVNETFCYDISERKLEKFR